MILAIDTATKWTGLALHDGRSLIAESGWYSSYNQTVELAPAVLQMLHISEIPAADLSAVALAIGPGSYTGLRIGLGFAKGIALANQLQLIGVPTLDILASALPRSEGTMVITAEAGRKRVWANNEDHRLPVAVEARNIAEVRQIVQAGADLVLLDNMRLAQMRRAAEIIGGRMKTEITGGVTLRRVKALARMPVDRVSIGALTHSAPALDIALHVERA